MSLYCLGVVSLSGVLDNVCLRILNEPFHEKTCFMLYANNKDTDQPAHSRSLISVFVVSFIR